MRRDPARRARQSAGKKSPRQTVDTAAAATDAPAEPLAADRILLVVSRIPRGTVSTYGAVATLAGLPGRARLVGRILGGLPDRTRLPWHRVVNASLRLSPRGDPAGVAAQRRRLEAEGVRFTGDRVEQVHLGAP
jgi:methylated-DNA-protein-cysteine methyltransferase-like protein